MANFPPEIWSQIADNLSIREAARLTRVCTNASCLKLQRLPMYGTSPSGQYTSPEGYIWAAKRWSNATELHVCLPCKLPAHDAWIVPVLEAAVDRLRELEGLYLRCHECNHEQRYEEKQSPLDWPLLSIILKRAPGLRVLHLVCWSMHMPVPMHGLQHIILIIGSDHKTTRKSFMSSILSAGNLKTLLLDCRAEDFRLGSVDLTSLSKLTAVSLRYVMPTSLVLPEQCALSVKVDSLQDAEDAVWTSVRQHIKAFSVSAEHQRIPSWQDLPAILQGESVPERVKLKCRSFGTMDEPICVGQGLAHVHRLKLVTKHAMHICVPENTSWKCLILRATGELDLEFQKSASEFQKDAFPEISLWFGSMRERGVLDLVSHRDLEFFHDRDCEMHYIDEPSRPQSYMWICRCQACCDCLKRSRVVSHAGWSASDGDKYKFF